MDHPLRGRLRVQHIDIDRHPDLVRRLHIGAVPTLLLIKDKRVVERLEGRVSAPKIEQMLDPHLRTLAA